MSRADTPNAAVPPRPGAAACDPGQPWASPCHKVRRQHLEGLAVVYVRQSTPQQVLNNCESTARQYALRDRAGQLGWPAGRVEVIDDDQGKSGQSAEGRPGFQSLLARIALGEVGPGAEAALGALRLRLKDPDASVQVVAAEALWDIAEDSAGLPQLLQIALRGQGGRGLVPVGVHP